MSPSDWRDSLGALLPEDYQPEPEAQPQTSEAPKPRLQVTLDRKRAGKVATIISGFDPDDPRAAEMCRALRRLCACGGSSRGGEILIQGDRLSQIKQYLKQNGY